MPNKESVVVLFPFRYRLAERLNVNSSATQGVEGVYEGVRLFVLNIWRCISSCRVDLFYKDGTIAVWLGSSFERTPILLQEKEEFSFCLILKPSQVTLYNQLNNEISFFFTNLQCEMYVTIIFNNLSNFTPSNFTPRYPPHKSPRNIFPTLFSTPLSFVLAQFPPIVNPSLVTMLSNLSHSLWYNRLFVHRFVHSGFVSREYRFVESLFQYTTTTTH